MMRSCLVTEVLKQRCYEGSCIWFHLNVCMKDLNLWEGRDHSNPSHDSFEFQKIFIIPFETDQTNNLTSCFSTGIFSKKIPELFFGNKIWYVCVSLKKKSEEKPTLFPPGALPHQPQPLGELHELRQRHGRHGRRLRLRMPRQQDGEYGKPADVSSWFSILVSSECKVVGIPQLFQSGIWYDGFQSSFCSSCEVDLS